MADPPAASSPLDLAEAHRRPLSKLYVDSAKRCIADRVRQVERLIRTEARISMNCRGLGLVAFLEEGIYRNLIDLVHKGKEPASAAFFSRLELERGLGHAAFSDRVLYGSLNVGNYGCGEFGPYCLVLNKDVKDRSAFILQNSVLYATSNLLGSSEVKVNVTSGHRSVWDNVHELAVIRVERLLQTAGSYDLRAICDGIAGWSDSIEAHVMGPVTLDDVEEIRVPPSLIAEMLYLRQLRKRTPAQEQLLAFHSVVLNKIEETGILVRIHLPR